MCAAAANLAGIERLVEALPDRRPELAEYGEWSWLQTLDRDDLREFIHDIREAIVVGARVGSSVLLEEHLRAWRITAGQADDPLFRSILLGGASEHDFDEVSRPRAVIDAQRDSPAAASGHGVR